MQQLNEYITSNGKRLRCGYTTGTCAAAAARAATELLLANTFVPAVTVETPAGLDVVVDIEEHASGDGWAECAVRKDAGDDPDVTDGALVFVRVSYSEMPGIAIDGGVGVGRVTKPGLDQPVGEAAINSVPRAMIATQVQEAVDAWGCGRGLDVVVSIPTGSDLAAHTFNPKLGIEGGISVLGTSGIVKPMSEDALISSIELELKVLREAGAEHLLVVPGNYGRLFAEGSLQLSLEHAVQCSNYLGATIDAARILGYSSMLVVGHIGKMVKVAGGIMNTHSRVADCRLEILAAHAGLAGASQDCMAHIMEATTTDAALDILITAGLLDAAMETLVAAIAKHLAQRAGDTLRTEVIVFSNTHGLLGASPGAHELAQAFALQEEVKQ